MDVLQGYDGLHPPFLGEVTLKPKPMRIALFTRALCFLVLICLGTVSACPAGEYCGNNAGGIFPGGECLPCPAGFWCPGGESALQLAFAAKAYFLSNTVQVDATYFQLTRPISHARG